MIIQVISFLFCELSLDHNDSNAIGYWESINLCDVDVDIRFNVCVWEVAQFGLCCVDGLFAADELLEKHTEIVDEWFV